MSATFSDYDSAIRAFWTGRDLQTQKQIETGRIDAGTRGAVTGGQHLTALQDLIAEQFAPLTAFGADIRKSGVIPLPGYYRRAKNWDIAVTCGDELVAAIECKSQSGSFGNNFNNRTEEAIGNAVDLRMAHKAGLLGSMEPWLGFVFVIEHSPGSTQSVKDHGKSLFRTDTRFDGSSYIARYRILFRRLVSDGLYDAACLITSVKGEGIHGEPVAEVSTQNLSEAIAKRVAAVQNLRRPGHTP